MRDSFDRDPEFTDAYNWYRTFQPAGADPATPVKAAYAEKQLAYSHLVFDSLDLKAEKIFTFSATAIGALLTAVKLVESQAPNITLPIWSWSPSLVCFLLALVLALIAKRPQPLPSLPRIRDVLQMTGDESSIALRLAAARYYVCAGMKRANAWKARLSDAATIVLVIGIVALGLIGFTSFVRHPPRAAGYRPAAGSPWSSWSSSPYSDLA